jgi:hypothetical protein
MERKQIMERLQASVDGQARVEAGSRPVTGRLSALRHQSSTFRAEVPLHDLIDRGTGATPPRSTARCRARHCSSSRATDPTHAPSDSAEGRFTG